MQLRKLLKEYVGGDLTLLGEIPEDHAMERAVRGFLPVVDGEPSAPSSQALRRIADALLEALSASPVLASVPQPAEVCPSTEAG
jgi:flagellar biosynthesis protein FlhG